MSVCGSHANIWLNESRLGVFVECDNMECGARSGTCLNIYDAISKWNTRYLDIITDEEVSNE